MTDLITRPATRFANIVVKSGGPIPRSTPLETALGLIHDDLVAIADAYLNDTNRDGDHHADLVRHAAANLRRAVETLDVQRPKASL